MEFQEEVEGIWLLTWCEFQRVQWKGLSCVRRGEEFKID